MPLIYLDCNQLDELLEADWPATLPAELRQVFERHRRELTTEESEAEYKLLKWVDRHHAHFEDGDLDDLVHEVCAKVASSINNQGLNDQIEFLLGEDIHPDVIRTYLHREGLDDDEEADDEIVVEGEE